MMSSSAALALVIAYAHPTPPQAHRYAAAIAKRDETVLGHLLAYLPQRDVSCVEAALIDPDLAAFRTAISHATSTT